MLRRLPAALPDLGLAVAYALAAADPMARDGTTGTLLWRAAIMEFFAIHASGFLKWPWVAQDWSTRRRVAFVLGLGAAYTTVLGIVSAVAGTWWPVLTFWALTGNRIADAAASGPPEADRLEPSLYAWAGTTALFVAAASMTGLVGPSRGAVLVGGAAYFGAIGVSELGGWWWAARWLGSRRRGQS